MPWCQPVQQVPYGSGDMYSVWFLGWPGGAPVGGGLFVCRLRMFRSVIPAGECGVESSSRAVSVLASYYLTVPLLLNFLYTFDTVLLILVFIVCNKHT